MAKDYAVYIMASRPHGMIYTGMSANPLMRVAQQQGLRAGGAAWALKFGTRLLVHIEFFEDYVAAREREVKLKKWPRAWKVNLIEARNPIWRDLSRELADAL